MKGVSKCTRNKLPGPTRRNCGPPLPSIARHVARIDEYQRQRLLETIALSAAITGAVTFTYGFLETAGFPRLSMFSVWIIMGGSWALVSGMRCWWPR
jgi:hypothetical protein